MCENNSLNYDKVISFAVCTQILIMGMKNTLVQGVPFLYANNGLLNKLLFLIIGGIYFYALIRTKDHFLMSGKSSLLIILLIVASFAGTFVFFPQNIPFMLEWLPKTIPFCFITGYFISRLSSMHWIQHYMCRYAYLLTLCAIIAALYIFRNGQTANARDYSMPLSYVVLVGAMWHLYDFFNRSSKTALLMAVIDVIIILAYGARNPLLAIGTYIIVKMLGNIKNKEIKYQSRKLYVLFNLIAAAVLLCAALLPEVIESFLLGLNINSRTIHLILVGRIFSSSGRGEIHGMLYDILNQYPLTGIGIAGDLCRINESAHSLFISIFVSYGYILGTVIIIFLAIAVLKALKVSLGSQHKVLVLFICMVLPRAFTGGDLWDSDVLWWLLGIILSILGNKSTMKCRINCRENYLGEYND